MRVAEWCHISLEVAGAAAVVVVSTFGYFWAIDNLPCSLRAKWCARPQYSEQVLALAADIVAMGEGYEWTATPKKK